MRPRLYTVGGYGWREHQRRKRIERALEWAICGVAFGAMCLAVWRAW